MDLYIEYVFFCFLCLAFTLHNFEVNLCCGTYQYFIPLCGISVYGNTPFDLSQLIHFLAIMNNDRVNIHGQAFV